MILRNNYTPLNFMRNTSLHSPHNSYLFQAAILGDLITARQAITYGANINAQTKSGDTALTLAIKAGSIELANVLLATGASPTVVNNFGIDALCRIASATLYRHTKNATYPAELLKLARTCMEKGAVLGITDSAKAVSPTKLLASFARRASSSLERDFYRTFSAELITISSEVLYAKTSMAETSLQPTASRPLERVIVDLSSLDDSFPNTTPRASLASNPLADKAPDSLAFNIGIGPMAKRNIARRRG
jgi:hypothetical protein